MREREEALRERFKEMDTADLINRMRDMPSSKDDHKTVIAEEVQLRERPLTVNHIRRYNDNEHNLNLLAARMREIIHQEEMKVFMAVSPSLNLLASMTQEELAQYRKGGTTIPLDVYHALAKMNHAVFASFGTTLFD